MCRLLGWWIARDYEGWTSLLGIKVSFRFSCCRKLQNLFCLAVWCGNVRFYLHNVLFPPHNAGWKTEQHLFGYCLVKSVAECDPHARTIGEVKGRTERLSYVWGTWYPHIWTTRGRTYDVFMCLMNTVGCKMMTEAIDKHILLNGHEQKWSTVLFIFAYSNWLRLPIVLHPDITKFYVVIFRYLQSCYNRKWPRDVLFCGKVFHCSCTSSLSPALPAPVLECSWGKILQKYPGSPRQ